MTTQSCAECGTRAEPGQSFCDACGAVLRWDPAGARAGTAAASSPAPAPASSASASAPASAGSPAPASAPHSPDAGPGWDAFARPGGPGSPGGPGAPPPQPSTGPAPAHGGGGGGAGTELPPASSGLPRRRPSGEAPQDTPGHESAPPIGTPGPTGNPGPTGTPGPAGTPGPTGEDVDEDTDPNIPLPPAPADAAHPAPPPPGAPPGTPAPPPGTPAPPPGDPMSDRARSLVVPVAEPEPTQAAPTAVAPVLPGRPDAQRPHVRAPGPLGAPVQGPPCPWCATPNRPDRHFCCHCAMPLADKDVRDPGPRPWWRRLGGPGRRETPWAGDRPRLRRVFDSIGTWIAAAIALTVLVLGIVYIPDGIQATRDHFSKRAPVEPDGIRASRSYPGHGPKSAFDKLNNTWWGPGVRQSGQGEWIEVSFARPTRLLDLIITPGVSTRADQLGKSALPHRVTAKITKADGKTATRELALDPGMGGQRRAFRVGEVTKVRFIIESAHAASDDKQVAIAEIEMFSRSNEGRG